MGTVVFPKADLKIFLTARPEVRAKRRYQELLLKFPDLAKSLSFDQILHEIEARDVSDSTREISPLKRADDAILIDTSDLTADEVIEKILTLNKGMQKKKRPPMKLSYKIVYHAARTFFRLFFGLKVYGLEHFRKGNGILVSNHASFYDPPVLSISWPEEVHFLARDSLFQIPILGALIRMLNTHPLKKGASDIQTFRQILQILGEGKKVILFPEGNRAWDGKLQPLERGLAFLVMKSKATIFPAYLQGTFEAWPRTKKWPKLFGKISCVFGSPIQWEEFEDLEKKEAEARILQRTEKALHALQKWMEGGKIGSPP